MATHGVAGRSYGGSFHSLIDSTSTGAGTAFDLGYGTRRYSMQATGLVAGDVLGIYGSLDGATWVGGGAYTSTAAAIGLSTANLPVRFVRMVYVTRAGGSTRRVNAWFGVA